MTERIGFGCYLPGKSRDEAIDILTTAIETGYRYFDTASFYETERALGLAIKQSGIPRNELQLASKLWIDEKGYQNTKDAFYRSLDRLQTEYLDTYLIHWPKAAIDDSLWEEQNHETLLAMEDLAKEGLIKNTGVSNFLCHHLDSALIHGHKPSVDQLELHPGYCQEQTLQKCFGEGIQVQAWSPLGRAALLDNAFLVSLSKKYGKSVSQICLIYLLQRGIMPLVKASSKERMAENLNIFDIRLDAQDMSMITCMPPVGWSGEHPDFVIPALKSNFVQ